MAFNSICKLIKQVFFVAFQNRTIYNQPERDSATDCKNRTTVATDDVDSCFCYSKNNCGVVTILYSHGPRAENNSSGYSQFNNFGAEKLIIGLCEESS